MNGIEVIGISKKYDEQTVLNNLTLTFEYGDRIALMGPSGCGKTTLLRIIAGLETADEGSIKGIQAGDFGMVFQEPRLFETMTAEQNVTCVLNNKKDDVGRLLLSELGFNEADVKKHTSQLSGGMQRRVAIARAVAYCHQLYYTEGKSPILLLDEAIKELDGESKQKAIALLNRFCDQTGCTLISITHDRAEAENLCHKIIEL